MPSLDGRGRPELVSPFPGGVVGSIGTGYHEQQQLLVLQHPEPQHDDAPGSGRNSRLAVWPITPW